MNNITLECVNKSFKKNIVIKNRLMFQNIVASLIGIKNSRK